ncbi:MAG: cytochrome c oxidase subunit II [Chloroflexota bacterium]|nr:cytochrome c oxidase subunit II [Chloroflexota bacterium]
MAHATRRPRRAHRWPRRSLSVLQQLIFVGGAVCLILSSCGGSPSALDPHGPGAGKIATLWWILFAVAAVVFVIVMGSLFYALFHRRRADASRPVNANALVLVLGVIVPAIILMVILVFAINTESALSSASTSANLTVEVVGHQWWWEVRYPDQQVATANEIHIPVGQTVQVKLTADTVIHSFWVPQLQAKTDAFPGRTTTTWLKADVPGDYLGECAEFCGVQHANMALHVIADRPDQYDAWMKGQQQTPPQPTAPDLQKGYQVFIGASCSYCHTVRGTNATANVGPDLTHLASRKTLAAGTIPNTPGNLAAWITSAQNIKPGNKMPSIYVNGDDLQALLIYLESLT